MSNKDLFEKTSIFKAIINLAIPSIIGQIILVIYNIADTYFVSMVDDDHLIAAITVCMPAFMFLSAISNLFGVGGASVMSRAMGKKNYDRAKNTTSFAFYGCLAVTIIYCLFALIFKNTFITLLGGDDVIVHSLAIDYLLYVIVFGGIPTALNTLFAHLVRAEGKSFLASLGIAIGGLLNVALDPLFMFVILKPGNEVLGVAIATLISNIIAFIYFIIILIVNRKTSLISLRFSSESFKEAIPKNVIIVGIPACLMTLCENISYAVLEKQMHAAGAVAAQSGIGVAKKINMLAHSIVRGMTQGVLPLIAYNKSSGNRNRMKKAVYLSGAMSVGVATLCMIICLGFANPLTQIFLDAKEGVNSFTYGVTFLRILCIGAPFSAIAYTIISFFQATGKGFRSLILALLRKGIVDIPLMFILVKVINPAVNGLVWATPIADIICSIIALILFFAYIKNHGHNRPEYEMNNLS